MTGALLLTTAEPCLVATATLWLRACRACCASDRVAMRCWLARFLALVVSILIGAASVRTAAGLFSRLQSVVDLSWARAITADLLWPREAR